MKLTITRTQWHALNDLRGLPDGAHMLVMCSRPVDKGAVLEGDEAAFRELVEHIGEDLADGMLAGRAAEGLVALCLKIDPRCGAWLGC